MALIFVRLICYAQKLIQAFLFIAKYFLAMGFIIFCVIPATWMLLVSFNNNSFLTLKELGNITLGNYIYIFKYASILKYFLNSLFIATISVVGSILSGLTAAYGFTRISWKGRDLVFNLLLAGLMLPNFILMLPTFLMWSRLQVYDSYIPLILPSWFGGSLSTVLLIRQYFLKIPFEIDEAAKIDGASHLTILFRILSPMSKPVIIVSVILCFIMKWNDFLEPLIYLSNAEQYTLTLGLQVFNSGNLAKWNLLMAACTLASSPLVILYLFFEKHISKSIDILYN